MYRPCRAQRADPHLKSAPAPPVNSFATSEVQIQSSGPSPCGVTEQVNCGIFDHRAATDERGGGSAALHTLCLPDCYLGLAAVWCGATLAE